MTQPADDEPLALAVHSLPSPQEAASERPSFKGRWKFVAIFVLCSLPVMAAYLAYFVLRPQGKAALGELIDPVRPVAQLQATAADGKALPLAQLKGQWLLVSPVTTDCGQDCRQQLFLHRQLRETLGKDKDRVDWVVVSVQGTVLPAELQALLTEATVLQADASVLAQWLPAAAGQASQHIFVVDPLGNTMMRFPARFDAPQAAKARSDLGRLLKASLNWDPPGR